MDLKSLNPFAQSSSRAVTPTTSNGDPFLAMRREMDRLFDAFARDWALPAPFAVSGGVLSPKINVAETESGLEVTAELPGIDQKDIDLNLDNGVLTIQAEHSAEKEEKDEKKQYHVVERSYGTFLRRIALPFEPDESKVEATFDKGVLKVIVPRSAEAAKQVRKIAIKGA